MCDAVEPTIATMLVRNRAKASSFRGGAYFAAIERPPDGEPWVQVKTGVLNLFYPSDEEPLAWLTQRVALPAGTVCSSWEPWKFATLEFPAIGAPEIAAVIEELFVKFYDFPNDTGVEVSIGEA